MLVIAEEADDSFVPWCEFKEKLTNLTPEEAYEALKNCHFSSQEVLMRKLKAESREAAATMTAEEYKRLLGPSSDNLRSEIASARIELAQLRREASWLANCAFSVLGFAAFAFFAAGFRFERVELRLVVGMLAGLSIFFIEVLIYIIIRRE